MIKFQCLLFVLKQVYICYYMICMTVPLIIFIFSISITSPQLVVGGLKGSKSTNLIKKDCWWNMTIFASMAVLGPSTTTWQGFFHVKEFN